jgi:hypothetical protein
MFAYWIVKNYREAYNIFACNSICFNHESSRRSDNFVTQKVIKGLCKFISNYKLYNQISDKINYSVNGINIKDEIYKKAGVILSDFVPDNALQTNLFIAPADARRKKLMNVIDNMNAAYRNDVLKFGTSSTQKNWKMRSEKRSKRFTTRWDELCIVK